MKFDKEGRRELPDPTPVELPLRLRKPETQEDMMRRIVLEEHLSRQAREEGLETFAEADDFEIDEDPDPISHYEVLDLEGESPYSLEGDPPARAPDTEPAPGKEEPDSGDEKGSPASPADPASKAE